MKKYDVLKVIVTLQAVCMVILAIVVIMKMWPQTNQPPVDSPPTPPDNSSAAAIVGGNVIAEEELESRLYEQYGDTVLRQMMVHMAIDIEAQKAQLDVSQLEVERELESMIDGYDSEKVFFQVMEEQLGMDQQEVREEIYYRLMLEKIAIRTITVTDAEVNRYILENPDQYAPRLQLDLQWIVVETEQEAHFILQRLEAGEPFELLARTYSLDEFTADLGGELGIIDADDPFYDQEILQAASQMQVGSIAGPIQVDGAYAIIELNEKHTTGGLSGRRLQDTVRKQIALSRADSLTVLEDRLLMKHNAEKVNK